MSKNFYLGLWWTVQILHAIWQLTFPVWFSIPTVVALRYFNVEDKTTLTPLIIGTWLIPCVVISTSMMGGNERLVYKKILRQVLDIIESKADKKGW